MSIQTIDQLLRIKPGARLLHFPAFYEVISFPQWYMIASFHCHRSQLSYKDKLARNVSSWLAAQTSNGSVYPCAFPLRAISPGSGGGCWSKAACSSRYPLSCRIQIRSPIPETFVFPGDVERFAQQYCAHDAEALAAMQVLCCDPCLSLPEC